MIKIRLKKNLIYLLVFYISWFVRSIVTLITRKKFDYDLTFIYLYLMIFAEIVGGLSMYLYQKYSIKKKNQNVYLKVTSLKKVNSITTVVEEKKCKRILLIFFASFFDFYEVVLSSFFGPWLNPKRSDTLEARLTSIQIIGFTLIYIFAFKFKTKRHHNASLVVIAVFLVITVMLDIIFNYKTVKVGKLFFSNLLILFHNLGFCFNNCIEKYLVDTDVINPFLILMFEGVFGILIAFIFSIPTSPFSGIKDAYKNNETGFRVLLIFLLFLYFVLAIIVNVYKIYCNVIYSPMSRGLIQYLLNPLINIYYFVGEGDFNKSLLYFLISEVICLVISFFGCVYNEYIILFFCDLEKETEEVANLRAITEIIPLKDIINSTSDNGSNLDNKEKRRDSDVSLENYKVTIK